MQIELERSRKIFRMPPITCETNVKCPINNYAPEAMFKATMTQFPINMADAVTGHKLQGRSTEMIIVNSQSNLKNISASEKTADILFW